jgi:RNA recognition motif-containing protein
MSDVSEDEKVCPWHTLNEFACDNAVEQSSWTTVMIRKIPNRYSQEKLLEEVLATGFNLNFLHLPKVCKSNANVGYAFANFASPTEAKYFMQSFEGHSFLKQPNNIKYAAVNYARLQGFEENISFFESRRISATDRKPWVLRRAKRCTCQPRLVRCMTFTEHIVHC